jgi:hypothetical protein
MEHLADTITLLSATAAGSLINAIAEGVLLTVVVSACLRLFPDVQPASRFAIWVAVLFATLTFHLVPLKNVLGESHAANANVFHLDPRWGLAIVGVWSIITLTRVTRLFRSAIHLHRISASAIPVVPEPACAALLRSGPRPALLCTSTEVDRPSVVGFFKPGVLLPEGVLSELSPQELEQIVMHEMEHLRRRDDWTNLIQKISLALFPLNPALNWIERRLCMERELACDDCVLSVTSARKSYASCLTNLAEHSLRRRTASLALGAWGKRSELAQRVDRILLGQKTSSRRTPGYVVTGVFIIGLLGGAVSLTKTPMLVSFSSPAVTAAMPASNAGALTNVSSPVQRNQEFSPTFVKAVMPEQQPNVVTKDVHSHRAPSQTKISRPQPKPRRRNQFVLTSSEVQSDLPRLIFTVNETTVPSYAALPVANGWLVIQL